MNNKKVIVRFFGGIGNQLFIYAASRRLSVVNDAQLILDDTSGFEKDYRYKRLFQLNNFCISGRFASPRERLEPFPAFTRFTLRNLNKFLKFENRRYIFQESNNFDKRLIDFKVKGSIILEGYWQSEMYFKDIEHIIRQDLVIKPPTDNVNNIIFQKIISTNSVAVHIRYFDQPSLSSVSNFENNVPFQYYQIAIREIEKRIPDAHYFIFSDRPEFVQSILPLEYSKYTLINHNQVGSMDYADLWLMSHCRHFIIANSTFSWWGAWLSRSMNKIVYVPGYNRSNGIMSWGFEGLIPPDWNIINF